MQNQSSGQSEVFGSVKSATAGRSGAQSQASTERARIAPEGLGLDGIEIDTLPAAPGGSETHPRRMPRGERMAFCPESGKRIYLEIHLNRDTLETRHCYVRQDMCLRFHDGFTEADMEAGWTHTLACYAEDFSEVQIEAIKARAAAFHQTYWRELMSTHSTTRVVRNGEHFVVHEVGTSPGFGGRIFKVDWFDKGRVPTVCNLSGQGTVPAWLRDELPDNAVITEVEAAP